MVIKHIMLDIETLGLAPNAVITQIAAVEFEPDSLYTGKTFNASVNINQPGRVIDPETLKWWLNQLEGTRKTSLNTSSQFELHVVLASLVTWIENIASPQYIKFWCRGVNFDFVLLDDAFRQYNLASPWSYRNLADVRTFDSLVPNTVLSNLPKIGNAHDAVSDALFQISYVRAALKWLKTNK